MGKILVCQETERGEKNYVAGVVTYVQEGLEGRVMNFGISVSIWNAELQDSIKWYLNFGAWNNENPEKPQMADRVRNAGIEVGTLLCVTCGGLIEDDIADDGTPRYKASVWNFKKNGRVSIPAETQDQERNIIIGTIAKTLSNGDYYTVSIPVYTPRGEETITTWYNISFKNNEERFAADQAREVLVKGTDCAILCGRVKKNNGFNDLWGFSIALGWKEEEAA